MAGIHSTMRTVAWVVLLAGASARVTSGADELPRYRLEPGMVLRFEGRATLKHGSDNYLEEQDTTAWVVRRKPDGSSRIVIRVGNRLREADAPDGAAIPAMEYGLGYFDLFPDGRLGPDAELGLTIDPAIAFPRLPDDLSATAWTQRDLRTGEEYAYSSPRREAGGWAFRAERIGPWKKVYGMSFASTYHFDRGMVVGAEQEFSQEIGARNGGVGRLKLAGVETKDAASIAAFAAAADRYLAAIGDYKASKRAALEDAGSCRSLLAEAGERLQAARDAIDDPFFRGEIDRKLEGHDAMVKACEESAKRRAAVVGKPSPDWELTGLDGQSHNLAEYRGKVVVLDFWFRSCGWCVKAMPEMNALAERFAGRPVAVLGMNVDAKDEDARFVIDAMGLKYETLCARGLAEKYGIQAFPTVVLIGPDGVVRDIHAGYSPALGADLGTKIDAILAREP